MANVSDILEHARHGSILSIAHRGSSLRAPENTIAAFLMAVAEGADGIELDVRLTKDGEVVVIHDKTLDRTTNGSGLVRKTSLKEIQKLDARDARFANERVPTLEEVVCALPHETVLSVELKNTWHQYELAEKTLKILQEYKAEKRTLIISFDPFTLRQVQKMAPEFVTALVHYDINCVDSILSILANIIGQHQIDILECPRINPEAIARANSAGKFVIAGSTNSAYSMRQIKNLGVVGIMSEDPKLLVGVLCAEDKT